MTAKRKTAKKTAKKTSKKTSKKKPAAKKKAAGSKTRKKKAAGKKAAARKKTATRKKAATGKKAVAKKKTAKKKVSKKAAPRRAAAVRKKAKKKTVKKTASKSAPAKKVARKVTRKKAAPPKPKLNLRVFREQLRVKHHDLMQAFLAAKGDTRQRDSDGTEDYIDYAVNSYDREFLLSLTELEQNQLELIEEALKRIERREYGSCVQCERPIPVKRLEVQPWARYCVRCQELADQGLVTGPSEFPDVDDFEPLDREVEEGERDA